MKTALITSDTYKNHNTGDGHPEKIDRVTAVIDNFKKLDNKNLIWKKPSKFEKSLLIKTCLLYTSPSPRDATLSRMPSSA